MTAIEGLGAADIRPPKEKGLNALSSEEFMKLVFAELSQQDPLQPNETKDLLQQISSIRSIQSDMELSDRLESIVKQNELSSAAHLIGDFVSGLTEGRERASDFVVSVSRTSEGPVLNLASGQRVAMRDVDEIIAREVFLGEDPEEEGDDKSKGDHS